MLFSAMTGYLSILKKQIFGGGTFPKCKLSLWIYFLNIPHLLCFFPASNNHSTVNEIELWHTTRLKRL